MYHISKQIMLISLAVLCATSMPTLVASQVTAADGLTPIGQQSHESLLVCRDRYHPKLVSQPLEPHALETRMVCPPLVEEDDGPVELRVPAALLTTLQTVERRGATVELQVPAALLTTLQTEGRTELP